MIRSAEISLVHFDLGGVVCRFQDLLWGSGFSRRCDRGEPSGTEMHRRARELLEWTADYAEFRRAWASAFEPDPRTSPQALASDLARFA